MLPSFISSKVLLGPSDEVHPSVFSECLRGFEEGRRFVVVAGIRFEEEEKRRSCWFRGVEAWEMVWWWW